MKKFNWMFSGHRNQSEDRKIGYLQYRSLPNFLREGQHIWLAHYDISGIQAYIFRQINIRSSAQKIAARSSYIANLTDAVSSILKMQFLDNMNILTSSSGNILCAFSGKLREERIREISDQIQRSVWASTGGQLELFYGLAKAIARTGEQVDPGTNASDLCWQDLQKQKFHCTNLLHTDFEKDVRDEFRPSVVGMVDEQDGSALQSDRKIYVAMKFDFDNLGAFFHSLTHYDESEAASRSLGELVDRCFDGIGSDLVRPVFTGGDDIFAITDLEHCYIVLDRMYENILRRMEHDPALEKFRGKNFGLSGGCTLVQSTYGEVPLIFFMEESEDALNAAKSIPGKNRVVFWSESLKKSISDAEKIERADPDDVYSWEQIHILAKVQREAQKTMEHLDDRSRESVMRRLRDELIHDADGRCRFLLTGEEHRILEGQR